MNKLIPTLLVSLIAFTACEPTESVDGSDADMSVVLDTRDTVTRTTLDTEPFVRDYTWRQDLEKYSGTTGSDAGLTDDDYAEMFDRPQKAFRDAGLTDDDDCADVLDRPENGLIEATHRDDDCAHILRGSEQGVPESEYDDDDYAEMFDRPEKPFSGADDSDEVFPADLIVDCVSNGECPQ